MNNQMTITEFCDKHNACSSGREWAGKSCKTMDDVWATAKPEWLIWVACQKGVLTEKELRLFAVWCGRRVQRLMKDKRSINAVDVAERYANGMATEKELALAMDAARAVARAAARDAASAAAWDAAWDAARDAAMDAARAAAWAAAWDAAWDAARDAAWAAASAAARDAASDSARYAASAAAMDAAWDAQAKYLRENCKPNFNKVTK